MDSTGEIDSREDEVLDKIREIVKESSDGKYAYRGQSNANHPVVSTLYREMVKKSKAIEGAKWLDVNLVQKEALEVARKFASEEFASEGYDNEKMLSRIQHYAGDTNLIDFTKDYLVALFFACNRKYGEKDGEDGNVFLLEITELENREKNREKNKEIDGEVEMITPVHPLNRVIGQKSVFIQSRTGIIDKDMDGVTMKVVLIPRDLKQSILHYLETRHDISSYTIYNDLHGYIRNREEHGNAVMEFYVGLSYSYKSDNAQSSEEKRDASSDAIKHYKNAIQLDPNDAAAYNNRGNAWQNHGDVNLELNKVPDAKSDYNNAINDHDEAIKLNPKYVNAYNNRGSAWRSHGVANLKLNKVSDATSNYNDAIKDYDEAIKLDPKHVEAYYNRGNAWQSHRAANLKLNKVSDATSNYNDAIRDYDKAIELDPKYVKAYGNRGTAKINCGDGKRKLGDESGAIIDYKDAIRDYDKIIEVDPKHVNAYYNRGIAKERLGGRENLQQALSDFEKTKELALQQKDQDMVGKAQAGIERVTAKIYEMDKS